jgi:hypothetical protein
MTANLRSIKHLPAWLPDAVRLYLSHTEAGVSLRALARDAGCHPSTVLRRVRRFERRRDDPLVDEALALLGRFDLGEGVDRPFPDPTRRAAAGRLSAQPDKDTLDMTARFDPDPAPICDSDTIAREGRRILRRLCESGSLLAIAPDLEKAVVLKETPDGRSTRIAVVAREVAQAFALKDWIACRRRGRVASYTITQAGRAALKRLLAEEEGRRGCAEAAAPFAAQHRDWEMREITTDAGSRERLRCNLAESPVAMLARRRDREGQPFLSAELVGAAERLREDFELAQMGPRVTQNWDRFLTGGERGGFGGEGGAGNGPRAARERVAAALRDLGPGLGDVALRCCCFLEGLEATERRMGWSARSGKIVLRIALTRLRRHYDEISGGRAPLIG